VHEHVIQEVAVVSMADMLPASLEVLRREEEQAPVRGGFKGAPATRRRPNIQSWSSSRPHEPPRYITTSLLACRPDTPYGKSIRACPSQSETSRRKNSARPRPEFYSPLM
jgi:hypothetical protein